MSALDLTAAIEAAAKRIWHHASTDVAGGGINSDDAQRLARRALTAAAPLIEAAVREQVAREIEESGPNHAGTCHCGGCTRRRKDARIARDGAA